MSEVGSKVRRELLLTPDRDLWASLMMGRPPGLSRNAVIEHAIDVARRREEGDGKADLILGEIGRLADALGRVAEGWTGCGTTTRTSCA